MTDGDLERVDALYKHLKEMKSFLQEERTSLEQLREATLSEDGQPSDARSLGTAAESLPRMLDVARRIEDWFPELERSIGELASDLAVQRKDHAQLVTLYDVSQVINSTLDLDQVLNLAMDQVIEVTRAERGFLMLLEEDGGELSFEVARNVDRETIAGPSFEISRSIAKRVAQEGVPLLATNAQTDPRFRDQSSVMSYNLRSILCVPLMVKREVTGVVYVDNRIKTGLFSPKDRDLLAAFANQAAVAIENARLFQSVRQSMNEIATMKNRMDNIFASIASGVVTTDVSGRVTMLNRAAEEILGVSTVEALGRPYDQLLSLPEGADVHDLVDRAIAGEERFVGCEVECETAGRDRAVLSINASPLRDAHERTLGVALVVDDLTEKRRLEEERKREQLERQRTREVLERYVHPAVVERMLSNPEELRLGGTKRQVAVLFADIGGFSALAEKLPPEVLVDTLNEYLGVAAEAVLAEGGMLDKFLGDAVMGVFNWPERQEDHCLHALRAASRIVEEASAVGEAAPDTALNFKVGVNVGEAVVGNVGIPQRSDYTAIGDAVNLAKRLQEHARPGQILLSSAVYESTKDLVDARPLEPVDVKGRSSPVQVYELLGFRDAEILPA
jgi:adenylate cyclase